MLIKTKQIALHSDYESFINKNIPVIAWLKEKHDLDWKKLKKAGEEFDVVEHFGSDFSVVQAYYNDLPGKYLVQYFADSNDDLDEISVIEILD